MRRHPETTTNERLLTVAALVMMIFLAYTDKNPLSLVISAAIILGVSVPHLINLSGVIHSPKRRWLVASAALLLVSAWVVTAWPEAKPPTSDVRVDNAVILPFQVGGAPQLNISLHNDAAYTLHSHQAYIVALDGGFASNDDLKKREQELWDNLEKIFAKDSEESSSSSAFYLVDLPPNVGTVMTLVGSTHRLTATDVSNLAINNGETSLIFMAISAYSDDSYKQESGLDFCVMAQNANSMVRCGIGHNGPRKPRTILSLWSRIKRLW